MLYLNPEIHFMSQNYLGKLGGRKGQRKYKINNADHRYHSDPDGCRAEDPDIEPQQQPRPGLVPTPDTHITTGCGLDSSISGASGCNMDHGRQHRSWLRQNHRPRHGPRTQLRFRCHHWPRQQHRPPASTCSMALRHQCGPRCLPRSLALA